MDPFFDQSTFYHATVKVANGGYILVAMIPSPDGDGELSYTSCVYTNLDTLCEGLKRFLKDIEGPDAMDSFSIPPQKESKKP